MGPEFAEGEECSTEPRMSSGCAKDVLQTSIPHPGEHAPRRAAARNARAKMAMASQSFSAQGVLWSCHDCVCMEKLVHSLANAAVRDREMMTGRGKTGDVVNEEEGGRIEKKEERSPCPDVTRMYLE